MLERFSSKLMAGWSGMIWRLLPFMLAGACYLVLGADGKSTVALVFFASLSIMFTGLIIEGLSIGYFGFGSPDFSKHHQPVNFWIQISGATIVTLVSIACTIFLVIFA